MSKRRADDAAAAKAFFAHVLATNVRWEASGLRDLARAAGGKMHPSVLLRALAAKIADNARLSVEECSFLYQVLLAVADGSDVREQLRIDVPKVGHRRKAAINDDIVRAIRWLAPSGRNLPDAIAQVAAMTGKTRAAVRLIWKRTDLFEREDNIVKQQARIEGRTPRHVRSEHRLSRRAKTDKR
jgi:hypothetical protein